MDNDKFGLVEKVLKDIDNVLSKNTQLYSFDIIPVDTNYENKSPVLHVDNCLGLESWCVKHVYMCCYTEIMDKFFSKLKRKAVKISTVNCDRLTRLLNVTLLLNPDLTFLWNKRREMVLNSMLEKILEICFTRLVLSRKPKCSDAFTYRRWLLEDILKDVNLRNAQVEQLINEDMHICELTAEKSPNNYHSWNHRIWFIKKLKALERIVDVNTLYIKEYEFSEKWASKHISDYSCFHYRQFCIRNILTITNQSWNVFENSLNVDIHKNFIRLLVMNFPHEATLQFSEESLVTFSENKLVSILFGNSYKTCKCILSINVCRQLKVLVHELILNNDLLRFYNQHETLWYHRRFVIHELFGILYKYFSVVRENGVLLKSNCSVCNFNEVKQKCKIMRYDSNYMYSTLIFNVLMNHEKKFVEERQKSCDNFATRHEKYLKYVEGVNNVV